MITEVRLAYANGTELTTTTIDWVELDHYVQVRGDVLPNADFKVYRIETVATVKETKAMAWAREAQTR